MFLNDWLHLVVIRVDVLIVGIVLVWLLVKDATTSEARSVGLDALPACQFLSVRDITALLCSSLLQLDGLIVGEPELEVLVRAV